MEIFLQSKLSWLNPVPKHAFEKCSHINLISEDGQVTCFPAQFLLASSTFLKSILMLPSSLCESSANSISLPSTSSYTLKLLAQILCKGETEGSGGLEITMSSMKELQDVIEMLGLNVNLCPKFIKEAGPFESVVVKREVLDREDINTPEKLEAQNNCDKLIIKKSTVAKMSSSSGQFRQSRILKKFKNTIMKNLVNENDEESFEELDTVYSARGPQKSADIQSLKQSSSGKLMQPGLLKDFEVKLVQCLNKGVVKKSVLKEEGSFICNNCGVKFSKYPNLRRHYRESHGVQDVMSGGEVVKPSVNKCPVCSLKFRFKGSLSRHLKRVHNAERKQNVDFGKDLNLKCGECDEMFSNFHHLRRHRKNLHSNVNQGLQEIPPVEITPVTSQDCGLDVTNMNDMSQDCDEVDKKNNDCTETVQNEVLLPEDSSKRLECPECDKRFGDQSDRRRHIERYHEGKTYGCGECDLICSYRNSVNRHCRVKGHDKKLIYMVVDVPSSNLEMS